MEQQNNRIPEGNLARIHAAVEEALATGKTGDLRILGYGEVSCVVASESEAGRFAVKALPPFRRPEDIARYEATFARYIARLESKGVRVAPSDLRRVPREDGSLAVYCIQPILDDHTLGPRRLSACSLPEATSTFARLLDHIESVVDGSTGLDAQISNWSLQAGEAHYLDVTTPLLRDAAGREELDIGLFLASLPAPLRPLVRRFLLRSILDKYYDRRGVVLDLLANLLKERLPHLVEPLTAVANERLEKPLTLAEVRAYYEDDAGMWVLLQRLRAADRFIQTRLLRRRYGFLLPGRIDR